MKIKVGWVERMVGVFILIAVFFVVAFLVVKANREKWFDTPLRVRVVTSAGFGLKPGTVVKLNGIEVGAVESVLLNESNQVLSTLAIRHEYADRIVEDAVAEIDEPPILGGTTIDIQVSSKGGRAVPENSILKVHEPENLFAKVGVTAGDVSRLVGTLNEILETVSTTLNHVEAITGDIREGRGSVGALITDRSIHNNLEASLENLNSILGKIERGTGALGRFLEEDTIYREVEGTVGTLRLATEDLRGMQGSVRDMLERVNQLIATTNSTMQELYGIVATINRGEGAIGKLVKDDTVIVEAQQILSDLRETVEDIREQAPVSTFVGAIFSAF